MTIVDLFVLGIPVVFLVGAFYSAGELTKRRMRKGETAPHGFLEELRALEDAFVDFFGSSKTSSGILDVLASRRGPIGFKALAAEVRGKCTTSIHHDEMPLTAIRAAVRILLFSRLACMSVKGFAITDLGREVHRRIKVSAADNNPRRSNAPPEATKESRATAESSPREARGRESTLAGASPWFGKCFEDPWVAAAIGQTEERFSTRSVKITPTAPLDVFRPGREAVAGLG